MGTSNDQGLSRRALLRAVGIGGLVMSGASLVARPSSAQALRPGAHLEVLNRLVGGKQAKPGRVTVKMPEIAENGVQVPLTVSVESPMTDQDYVKAVHVVADDNPNPDVLSVYFTPACGKAEVSTRMRLAKTQRVIAYAEMSDGSVWSGQTEVKVTIGGCGG